MKRRTRARRDNEREAAALKNKRCVWTEEEDNILLAMARKKKSWGVISEALEDIALSPESQKTPKQCRERWHNKVSPNIVSAPWSEEEKEIFFQIHKEIGAKWSEIAVDLPGRTDNSIKNFFFCSLRKVARRLKKGIVSEDMIASPNEVAQTLYLLEHIAQNYFDPEDGMNGQYIPDKYVIELLKKDAITKEKIMNYIKDYKAAANLANINTTIKLDRVSNTEDSQVRIPPLPIAEPYVKAGMYSLSWPF